MAPRLTAFYLALALAAMPNSVIADEEANSPKIGEVVVESNEGSKKAAASVDVDKVKLRRTTIFDETEIKKLYKNSKSQNEKLNEGLPAHLNPEEMDLVTLKTLNVGGADLKLQRDLVEALDPQPRRRLQRIAEIDPDAAHEMMVTMRNDHEFMTGRYDRASSSGDPGRQADFTGATLGKAIENAIGALQKATGSKKKEADPDTK